MIVRVARAFHHLPAVIADQPFAETALAFLGLVEEEELEDQRRDAEDLRLASRVGVAVWEPRKLAAEHRALRARARGQSQESAAEALARGRALVARLTRGGVMLS